MMYEQWPSGLKMFRQSDDKKVVKHICYEFSREIGMKNVLAVKGSVFMRCLNTQTKRLTNE